MKKIFILLINIFFLFVLAGCSKISGADKVKPPYNKLIPIKGTYKVETQDKTLRDREFVFLEDEFSDGNENFNNINYRVKLVDMAEYLLYGYKIENSINKGKEVQIVTVSSSNRFLYDFIKLDENNIILIYNSQLYKLKKVDKEGVQYPSWKRFIANISDKKDKSKDTALYLGIRSTTEYGYKYKTVYVGAENGNINDIYVADKIFLPRKNGFWRVDVEGQSIRVENITKGQEIVENKKKEEMGIRAFSDTAFTLNQQKNIKIDYIGNDYLSLEETNGDTGILKIVPVDNPMQDNGISIYDLMGQKYRELFDDIRNNILKEINGTEIHQDIKYQNIGIMRKNGTFLIKGRINYEKNNTIGYMDFNTGFIPPNKIVMYDELSIAMKDVKDKIPQAEDVYTSPNGDIAVVVLPQSIEFYQIKDGNLSEKLNEIKTQDGDKIVMVEWATGSYSKVWRESFLKNNSVERQN